MRFSNSLFLVAIVTAAAWGIPALAHHPQTERELFLQIDEKGTVGVVRYAATGKSLKALRTMYDLDRDGVLGQKEGQLLALVLCKQAVKGIEFSLAGEAVDWTPLSAELESVGDFSEKIFIKALFEWSKPAHHSLRSSDVELRVLPRTRGKLHLQLQTLGRWIVKSTSLGKISRDSQGIQGRLTLSAGDRWRASVQQKLKE